MKSYILRGWFYYRVGQSAYISLFLGLVSFLLIGTLYLHTFFPDFHFWQLAVLVIVPDTIGAIGIGIVHVKKQLNTDNFLATLQNPFLYSLLPGKEAKIGYPATLLNLKVMRRFCEVEDMMDEELRQEFDQIESRIKDLLDGKKIE